MPHPSSRGGEYVLASNIQTPYPALLFSLLLYLSSRTIRGTQISRRIRNEVQDLGSGGAFSVVSSTRIGSGPRPTSKPEPRGRSGRRRPRPWRTCYASSSHAALSGWACEFRTSHR